MKRILPGLILMLMIMQWGHTQAKRYIFMEHFTNTRCGVCAGSNPGYYSLLNQYKGKYHHLSIHPQIPYSSCLLYQANKDDQSQRASFYAISGTPTVVFNGLTKKSAGSVTAALLDAELKKESPIQLVITETGSGVKNATVEVKTLGDKPSGKYRIYTAIVEKELNYASPNGEKIHYDVFRDFMSASTGDPIELADKGGSVVKNFSIQLLPNWIENQMYVLAWIQEETTKEVLNSGTRFDLVNSTEEGSRIQFDIQPNPVNNRLAIQFPGQSLGQAQLSITNLFGKVLHESKVSLNSESIEFNVQHYNKGIYFVKIQNGRFSQMKKWIKQ